MRRALIGHTGFVGTNLKAAAPFEGLFKSTNISELEGQSFDLAVCAAAPATMWAANANPEKDLAGIRSLLDTLGRARIKRLVLVSTIAVFSDADGQDDEESTRFETAKAYGRNRRLLEEEVASMFKARHILRLPALFGAGLKKNFVFDILNPIPSFLKADVLERLLSLMKPDNAGLVRQLYVADPALGMMRFDRTAASDRTADVEAAFQEAGFGAPNFTNSASRFQFYGLHRLWDDICRVIDRDIGVLNVAVEPLSAANVHAKLTGRPFENSVPPVYREDMRSRFAADWSGEDGYLYSAETTLRDLVSFCRAGSSA